MGVSTRDTVSMEQARRAEVDAVVGDEGVVIPLSDLASLDPEPGQQVHVTVTARRRRKNMRGVLEGKLPDVSLEEFEESSREAWGEWTRD